MSILNIWKEKYRFWLVYQLYAQGMCVTQKVLLK